MDPIYEEIMAKVRSREQQLANERGLVLANDSKNITPPQNIVVNSEKNHNQAREVYKDEKIKRYKDISRLSEEIEIGCESLRDSSLAGQSPLRTCAPLLLTSSGLWPGGEERDSIISDATTCSREMKYSGISVQHNITSKGIKVSINLQTPLDAYNNTMVPITAELKRSERLREIKEYQFDTDDFKVLVNETIKEILDMPKEQRAKIAAGRAHVRGQRGSWFQNVFVVGIMDDFGALVQVILNLSGEEYEINLDKELTLSQTKLYHSSGIYGELKLVPMAPTLDLAPRTKINR